MASERANQEFLKLFPDSFGEILVKEIKCCLNERTNRGVLYLTRQTLNFYSKMLGETKLQVPLEKVISITLGEPSVSQAINVETIENSYKFLYFQQSIDEAFESVEAIWKEIKEKNEATNEVNQNEKQENNKLEEEITVKEQTKELEAPPEASIIKKKPSTNSIREQMRQRQAKAQKQRELSEAKIKAKASVSRQKIEETKAKETTGNVQDSLDNMIRFAKQFGISFIILWICAFIIPNYLTIDSWRSHLAVSALLGSLKTSLNLEGASRACVPLISTHIPSVAEHYLAIGLLCVFRSIVLLFTCFVIPDFHITGIIGFFLVLGATSSGEIVRATIA